MPTARVNLTSSVVEDSIFAIGGRDNLNTIIPYSLNTAVEEYDQVSDSWYIRADLPTPRYSLINPIINNKIYAIGGFYESGNPLASVEEYDAITDLGLVVQVS